MNSSGLLSLSAEAMTVSRFQTSAASSAWSAETTPARRRARRVISGPVAGVDPDVAFGEVAGPEAGRAFAFAADGEANLAFGGIQLLLQIRFRKRRGEAAAAHRDALHHDVGFGGIEGHARIAGGGKNAAPIGVGAGDGGLDQRGIGDGSGQASGGLSAGCARDVDGHEFPGAFAIARDLLD